MSALALLFGYFLLLLYRPWLICLRIAFFPDGSTAGHQRAKKALVIAQDSVRIECFTEAQLMFNVTKHSYVPRHRIVSASEKEALLAKYKIEEDKLPKIQMEDPVARYFGAEVGDVFRIERPSETAGRYITYRIVIR